MVTVRRSVRLQENFMFSIRKSIRFSKPCFCHLQNIAEFSHQTDWQVVKHTKRLRFRHPICLFWVNYYLLCQLGRVSISSGNADISAHLTFQSSVTTLSSGHAAFTKWSMQLSVLSMFWNYDPTGANGGTVYTVLFNDKKTCCRSRGPNIEASAWGQHAFGSLFRSKINFSLWVPVLS